MFESGSFLSFKSFVVLLNLSRLGLSLCCLCVSFDYCVSFVLYLKLSLVRLLLSFEICASCAECCFFFSIFGCASFVSCVCFGVFLNLCLLRVLGSVCIWVFCEICCKFESGPFFVFECVV